ncbi:MAG TPA: YcxB family protein [Bacilli bacterium]|nr:MAG: hypothetical protein BWY97_01315 [Tenericutes bacterium ADurb.BinA124]HNZ50042.1 YcxB family protein [Bacilli bacterium]HPN61033.1 YcxB family protein [Bacilli bacterium]HPX84176.1 YcxB family protein [Bacilli bacterium]HQC74232.1 YcxB family protein [Bacilli bacterium]
MEITANCQYSEERAKQFFRFHMLVKSPAKYIYYGLAFLSLAFGVYLIAKNEAYFGIFCLFLAVIIIVVRLATAHTTLNKIMKDLRFPTFKYQLVFSESSLSLIQGDVKTSYPWNKIIVICETKTMMYFYTSASQALILGKYLLSDQERHQVQQWLSLKQVKHRFYRLK